MDDFDVDLPAPEVPVTTELSEDGETVIAVDRHGHSIEVPRYGPIKTTPQGKRFRSKVLTDECAHDGTGAQKVKAYPYGTAYCPSCDGSRGPDGLWRVLEDA
jgi:hypothetical protein